MYLSRLTVAVALKLVTIFHVQHICIAQCKVISLPLVEESAAVQHSEAAHTNKATEAVVV